MPSSPKPSASTTERAGDLMAALSTVPDPRDPRGVRYPLAGMLAVAVCAVLAGHARPPRSGNGSLDLSADHLTRLDVAALDAALAVFAWCHVRHIDGPTGSRRVIAIDGKTIRGAAVRDLRAAFDAR